jgi:F-type H+-transporting ATPase subunit epsilon
MAHPPFSVHVLTPDGDVYDGEVEQLSTRTGVGEVGILANHVPMLARLVPAELRLHVSDSETLRYAQGEGWLEVFANQARVLVSEAVPPDDLDASELKEKLADAEQRRDEAEEGSAAREQAEREVARAEAFIGIAEGS